MIEVCCKKLINDSWFMEGLMLDRMHCSCPWAIINSLAAYDGVYVADNELLCFPWLLAM